MLARLGRPPAPGDAVDLLLECHGRIRSFLALARRLAVPGTDRAAAREASESVRRYFAEALPLHARDEEESLLPRLRGRDREVDGALEAMAREHEEHRRPLAALVAACEELARAPGGLDEPAAAVARAAGELERDLSEHLAREEAIVFPAVRRLLGRDEDAAVAGEMRARRGARSGGPIARFLREDHARLEELLARSVASPGALAAGPFEEFRAGLLRHIAREEKVLFPAVREALGGRPLEVLRRLRVEHGALASLLVPSPTPGLVGEIRSILVPHDAVEEGPGGLYDACDALLAPRAPEIVERMRAYPPVKVAAHGDGPRVLRTAAEALRLSALQHERR